MEIGAQIFTLRSFCKTPEAFADSLARVADIGYRNVQISKTCPFDPAWLRDELKKNGLRCVLTHTPEDRLLGDAVQVAADHDVYGCEYVGLGWYGFDPVEKPQAFEEFFRLYVPVAKTLKEHGKYFMYHNHEREFRKQDGKRIIEWLAERMPADEMGFTLDTFWVQASGGDPAEWIKKLSGRVPCIHLKDFSVGKKMAVVGEGNMNFVRIFEKAESAGTRYMLVEQDDCNGENPFDCLKRSYDHLHALGFR